jgi:transposase
MFSTGHNDKMIEVLSGPERRRRRTPQEKIAIVQQTMEPGMTVSHVARLHGVNANQVFTWRRQYQNGSLTAVSSGEEVVPASELTAAMKQIKELQRLLGKKPWRLNSQRSRGVRPRKKWIAHAPLLPGIRTDPHQSLP